MNKNRTILASIELEKNDDGYLARIPGVQGAFAEGDTIQEAVFNLIDVAKLIFEYRRERNEKTGFNEFVFSKNSRLTFSLPLLLG
jgi:predicted RNase H-like HicB family nuclease